MGERKILLDAFKDEDLRLRRLVDDCPCGLDDRRTDEECLSLKATLGHIAYWDDFTVEFFACKLDPASNPPPPPLDFETVSANAIAAIETLTFNEVRDLYTAANEAILGFLHDRWNELSVYDRHQFWVPLQHRRQHRLMLEKTLVALKAVLQQGEGEA